ncbi:DUF397 domain-containing protein [Actinoplanes sp. NPDC049599]|uniref:DUF397 domain-containing protein n=1 Tax=Actinoplanes sp. NPDC049599 TaxID=3363903 RepID=UPI0037A4B55D
MQTDRSQATWRRSARCVSDHHCVEIADLGELVGLRNSQVPDASLAISRPAWRHLVAGIKAGEFDQVRD